VGCAKAGIAKEINNNKEGGEEQEGQAGRDNEPCDEEKISAQTITEKGKIHKYARAGGRSEGPAESRLRKEKRRGQERTPQGLKISSEAS